MDCGDVNWVEVLQEYAHVFSLPHTALALMFVYCRSISIFANPFTLHY
jgi:hypothetical protein